jgi:hypothetical protein
MTLTNKAEAKLVFAMEWVLQVVPSDFQDAAVLPPKGMWNFSGRFVER